VVLLLGSNIGNTLENIENAIAKIEKRIGKIDKFSKILETKPVEFVSNNIFRNIALAYIPQFRLFLVKRNKKHRKRDGRLEDSSVKGGYEDRIIDIDIVNLERLIFNLQF
jgi:2-amino-4-hydroxy-6-hydroxymethyldihydropteridine diphosphokinase